MNSKNTRSLFVSLFLLVISSESLATTLSYVLDQSNALPDNVDYLTVTISDDVEGQLDFWVDVRSPLTDIAGKNFGIQKFAFNVGGDIVPGNYGHHRRDTHRQNWWGDDGRHHRDRREGHGDSARKDRRHSDRESCLLDTLLAAEDFILPDGWNVKFGKNRSHGGDGFNVRLLGNGSNRQDPLHFSVLGLELENVLAGFSAYVAGFEYISGDCGHGNGGHKDRHAGGCRRRITSAYFFGDRPIVVPLPATVWLLGSGLLGFVGVAQRRRVNRF